MADKKTVTVVEYHDCPGFATGTCFPPEPKPDCPDCGGDGYIAVGHEVPRAPLVEELCELETRFAGPRGPASDDYHPRKRAALQPRIDELKELLGRHFWQRTQAACGAGYQMPPSKHREYVKSALEAGKDVPSEVLAEYPELST